MNRFYLFAALLIALCSCQKEINIPLTPATPGTGSGTGGGGGTGVPASINYQPTTKNSFWKYQTTGQLTYDALMTSTGVKKTITNIEFIAFTGETSTSPGVKSETNYGMKGRDYYVASKGVSPNTGAAFDINIRYLNDTAAVGYKWEHAAGQGNGFTARTPGEIIERNITMTVAGKQYKEVIHTRVELQYDIPLMGTITFAVYDFYNANNIGSIKVVTTTSAIAGSSAYVTELTDYSIK
jgi:hypothetical protein